jgi:hypothetical protein
MFNVLPTSQWNISKYCKPIHGTRFSETGHRMSTKIDHFFVFVSIAIKTSNRKPQWNILELSPRPHTDLCYCTTLEHRFYLVYPPLDCFLFMLVLRNSRLDFSQTAFRFIVSILEHRFSNHSPQYDFHSLLKANTNKP